MERRYRQKNQGRTKIHAVKHPGKVRSLATITKTNDTFKYLIHRRKLRKDTIIHTITRQTPHICRSRSHDRSETKCRRHQQWRIPTQKAIRYQHMPSRSDVLCKINTIMKYTNYLPLIDITTNYKFVLWGGWYTENENGTIRLRNGKICKKWETFPK